MNQQLDYGVIRNKATGLTESVWVKGTSVSYIFTDTNTYDKMKWEVVYRGTREDYTGPQPDSTTQTE